MSTLPTAMPRPAFCPMADFALEARSKGIERMFLVQNKVVLIFCVENRQGSLSQSLNVPGSNLIDYLCVRI